MNIPTKPQSWSRQVVVILREDDSVSFCSDEQTLDQFLTFHSYKRDYSMGEVIALAREDVEYTTFSHWAFPGGCQGEIEYAAAIFCHTNTFEILRKWRVGRAGKLTEV